MQQSNRLQLRRCKKVCTARDNQSRRPAALTSSGMPVCPTDASSGKEQSCSSITTPATHSCIIGMSSSCNRIGWRGPKMSPLANEKSNEYAIWPAAPVFQTRKLEGSAGQCSVSANLKRDDGRAVVDTLHVDNS